mmetsp:Transcript_76643/g.203531  ORF Transcript_76643/g.203531 Transcript_76643/m.203531 type:complete len:222 (+) Transcript_76643:251-916(+)
MSFSSPSELASESQSRGAERGVEMLAESRSQRSSSIARSTDGSVAPNDPATAADKPGGIICSGCSASSDDNGGGTFCGEDHGSTASEGDGVGTSSGKAEGVMKVGTTSSACLGLAIPPALSSSSVTKKPMPSPPLPSVATAACGCSHVGLPEAPSARSVAACCNSASACTKSSHRWLALSLPQCCRHACWMWLAACLLALALRALRASRCFRTLVAFCRNR